MKKIIFVSTLLIIAGSRIFANSPYIHKIHEFHPAPGQFVNIAPSFEAEDSYQDILSRCEEYLVGKASGSLVSLGAYGGYIVFSFDHNVVNSHGAYDFKIYGNAFRNSSNALGGSSEPGIVMVSYDDNGNGLPDDQWYELAGSEYYNPTTKHDYEITYYKPSGDAPSDAYVKWTSNDPDQPQGYVTRNTFHTQSYWPMWVASDKMTFKGARLTENVTGDAGNYVLHFLERGYADNRPNAEEEGFKIDWAVDSAGNAVYLPMITFVKVYTAVNQCLSMLGETSTEIMGAEDFHPEMGVREILPDLGLYVVGCRNGQLEVESLETCQATIYNVQGGIQMTITLTAGSNIIDVGMLTTGIYLVRAGGVVTKFIR